MKIDTILVPTDFSADANEAAENAVALAKQFGARIVLLHAYHLTIPLATPTGGGFMVPAGFYEDLRKAACDRVETAARELAQDSGVDVTGVARSEPASVIITHEAEQLAADLIVMGTRGHTGLKHAALGSVAERIVRTAPCPVLVVKARS